MANNFLAICKLREIKSSDKFSSYGTKIFDSGWGQTTLKFNMICGNSRHMATIQAGAWMDKNGNIDEKKTVVYSLKNAEKDGDSPTPVKIPYAKRLDKDVIESTPNYRTYVVDTEIPGRRYKLSGAVKAFKDGSITDETMDELGVHTEEEAKAALEKSESKRHTFIYYGDFLEHVNKLLKNSNAGKKVWKIRGNIEYQYSERDKIFYRNYVPTKIYLAEDDEVQGMTANFNIFFNKDSFDDQLFDEKNKYYINGFIRYYDSNYKNDSCKGQLSCPMTFVIDGKDEKKAKVLKKRFTTFDGECEWKELGVVCECIDGAETVEITMDQLSDDQREDIEAGLVSFDEIKREMGGYAYGDRIIETRIVGLQRGFSGGAKDTVYSDSDFEEPKHDEKEDTEDIFADEDDDLDI